MAVFAPHRPLTLGWLALAATALLAIQANAPAQQQPQPVEPTPVCTVDLKLIGVMSDILSNALMRGLRQPEATVRAYLEGDAKRHTTSEELLRACAMQFKIPEATLATEVERFRHCNCSHAPLPGQQPLPQVDSEDPLPPCNVDLTLAGAMRDVLSNALVRGLDQPASTVDAYLNGVALDEITGEELLRGCAKHFAIPEARLQAEVERFRHCNCSHAPLPGQQKLPGEEVLPQVADSEPVSVFAKDVTLHVVLHELGHALIREFDLPVLGNEETTADAFATHYLTHHMPERALAALKARVASLQIEAREVPRAEWPVSGEHDNDARRAFQIAALAVAADAKRYAEVATLAGMSESDITNATDYGAEIHRSWRRILAPLWMPSDRPSNKARVLGDPALAFYQQLEQLGLVKELQDVVTRFDWHSLVTIRFVDGTGGASWSRSKRTVTVNSEYLRRFIAQGMVAGF